MMVFKLNNMVIEVGLIILESRCRLGTLETLELLLDELENCLFIVFIALTFIFRDNSSANSLRSNGAFGRYFGDNLNGRSNACLSLRGTEESIVYGSVIGRI